ncbi:MAG: SdrD B-like domain-containing protein, partial [Bacteroidia bacterium]
WHHIAVSYDGDSAFFFLDGVADGAVRLNTTIVDNAEALIIGAELPGSADYFDGKIDEVALYSKALSEAEVAQLMMYNSQLLALDNMLLNWSMEEGTGLTTADETGNGLTGSLVNGTGWTLGQVGNYALNFDGIDDYVLSDNMERDLDSTFAFSMWIKTTNSGAVQYLLSHDDIASNPDGEAWLQLTSGGLLQFEYRQSAVINTLTASSGSFNDGSWHHMGVTYNGTDLDMYRDGVQVASFAAAINLDTLNSPIYLASDTRNGIAPFGGQFDHLYVFDDSLSTGDIDELYRSFYPSYAPYGGECPLLIGAWDFEEGSGTSTKDESGAGMSGTLVNGPVWTPGQFGSYGLDFSGNSLEYVDYGSSDFNLGSGFAIGFWLQSDGSDYLETILAKGTPGTAGHWQVYLNYGELYFRTDAPATISETSNFFFTDSLWHHVLINYNGGALMYYVDGNLVHTTAQAFNIPALNASLTLGRRPDVGTNEFNGALDQLMIYNCALSDVQISRLLETGTIEALATQELQVFFLAKDPSGVSVGTQNSICVSGALFTDGRPANQGCDIDLANVTIINTGSIQGRVFGDVDGDGWQGSLGYEAGEIGIPAVRVVLESCTDFDGVGKVCNVATTLDTVYTDLNGDYSFIGLLQGVHYRVSPLTADLPDSSPTTTADPDDDPLRGSGDGGLCGGSGAACDDKWDNAGDWFEMFNDDWGGDDEEVSAINFGYQIDGSIFGLVWNDINGNGVKDALEPVMDGVMVTLSNGAFAFTDENGIYTLQDIIPGSYTVSVNEASLPWGGPWTETGESDGTINNLISQTMTAGLVAGSHDFGYQAMGSSELGDQLYYDWDGDGVQDSNEEGISDITVNLYRDVNANGVRDAYDIYLSNIVTDQDGYYVFSNLPEGSYLVGVDENDPDFPQATQTGDPDELGACLTCDGWGSEYVDGFWFYYDMDFGYKPLGTGAIGDLVWYDLDGNQQQAGSLEIGLPNISVTLKVDLNQDGIFEDIRTTVTDIQGNYSFTNLPDGGYEVIVDSTDTDIPQDGLGTPYTLSTDGVLSFTITNGAVDQIDGTACTVCNLNLDFGFTRLSAIGDMIYWDANNNGTQDANETGIANVTVYLCDGTINCTSANAIATTTTSDGTDGNQVGFYLFTELAAGTYTVSVDPASTPLVSAVQTADPNSDGYSCDDPNIAILGYPSCDNRFSWTLSSSSQYVGADFGYLPLGVIGDYVWYDQNGDGLQDDGEQGFDGVEVYLCTSSPCNGANAIDTVITDYDGGYTFDELTDGTYYINVNLGGAYTPTSGAESIGSFDAEVSMSGGVISAVDGAPCSNCDLDVDFGFELVGPYSISGTVCLDDASVDGLCTGLSGEIAEEDVVLYLYDASNNLLATTDTDVNGNYNFNNLATGTYVVSLSKQFAPLSTADLTTTNADVPAGGTITESGSTVYQTLPLSASIVDADFAFIDNSTYDFGDLPSPYSTTTATNPLGAYHRQISGLNLYLGSLVDSENEGIASGDAYGDDGDNSDDEDGVGFGSYFGWSVGEFADGNGGSVDITVTGTGYLVAWMDFNKDGDFGDAGEMIVNTAATTGTNTYQFDIPFSTTFTGEFFSRFRLFENRPAFPAVAYLGLTDGGEVEDYLLSFQPLPVEMLFFQAERKDRDVAVKWGLIDPEELPSHFELERSLDGRYFETIYQQDALDQDGYLEYNFLDQGIMETGLPKVFYRLKQVAKDGIPSFSHIVEINLSEEPMILLSLYPNPVATRLFAQYTLRNINGDDLLIVNSLGQTIWTRPVAIKDGMHTESIDVSQWAAGIYYLQLRHETGKEVFKFIVE